MVTNKELTNEELQAIVAAKKGKFCKEQCYYLDFFYRGLLIFLLIYINVLNSLVFSKFVVDHILLPVLNCITFSTYITER